MKLFGFLKKKEEEPEVKKISERDEYQNSIGKKEFDRLVAFSLDILSQDNGTIEDVKNELTLLGYNEQLVNIISLKANNVYVKYYIGHSVD